ncbi:MAG: N-glycosylase/DNA lyase [Candidatus Omnitrophica bacterium]|nr:N-glycosylase/DNA lyase [Candidatus Omnitrophota bacterium]
MKRFPPIPVPVPLQALNLSRAGLAAHYKKIKPAIKRRISEFRAVIECGREEDIFSELCFCILTANAGAVKCDEAMRELSSLGLIAGGTARQIRPRIKGRARFHNKKADYITGARKLFEAGRGIDVRGKLDKDDIVATRDWLAANIKGYGYKEASHFLRNIGLGREIAILDRHILKNLRKFGVINAIPESLSSRKIYLSVEDKMRRFSRRIGIPMDELDLLFWSMQTGYIFK